MSLVQKDIAVRSDIRHISLAFFCTVTEVTGNMSSPTELHLPLTFPYPIRIVSIDAPTSSDVQRGARLLSYSFVHLTSTPGAQPETRFGTWDAAIDGSIHRWNIKTGDFISFKKAKEKPALSVVEPCKHGMQLGGLCVLCGKDMTKCEYYYSVCYRSHFICEALTIQVFPTLLVHPSK